MKKLLLVEDDEYKATDILKTLSGFHELGPVERAASVTSALRAISSSTFDLVILDMSLPTFDISGPGGGGSPEGQGGIEVIRLARRLSNQSSFLIITQYPDIDILGREFPLDKAADALSRSFGVSVLECIHYDFDGDAWREPVRRIIEAVLAKK